MRDAARAPQGVRHPVWCIRCHCVWDGAELAGEWPHLVCADAECSSGQPVVFLAYQQTRLLLARHWPRDPQKGERLELRPSSKRHAPPPVRDASR